MFKQFLAQISTISPTPAPTATASASITSTLSPAATTPITLPSGVIPWALAAVAIVFALIFFVRAQQHKAQAGASGASPDSASDKESFFRNEIARILLYASIGGLVILGGLIILLSWAAPSVAMDKAKTVFDSLLPVFGTWVGTLLAFYFGKANFESGARVAQGAAGADSLRTIPVKDKMIGPGKITTLPPDLQGKQDSEIPLKKVSEHLKSVKLDRLPLFAGNKASGVAEKIVHLSKIEKYLADKVLKVPSKPGAPAAPAVSAGPAAPTGAPATPAVPAAAAGQSAPAAEPPITELTLANLFNDQPKPTFENFTFVKESATLADAKLAMDSMTNTPGVEGNCYDVFATASGDRKEPVIGWITNDIINENAKV